MKRSKIVKLITETGAAMDTVDKVVMQSKETGKETSYGLSSVFGKKI